MTEDRIRELATEVLLDGMRRMSPALVDDAAGVVNTGILRTAGEIANEITVAVGAVPAPGGGALVTAAKYEELSTAQSDAFKQTATAIRELIDANKLAVEEKEAKTNKIKRGHQDTCVFSEKSSEVLARSV